MLGKKMDTKQILDMKQFIRILDFVELQSNLAWKL
jgi:hypothetical protein